MVGRICCGLILSLAQIFALLGLVMHNYNEFETKENQTQTKDKIETQQKINIHADVLGLKGTERLLGRSTVCIMQCSWAWKKSSVVIQDN